MYCTCRQRSYSAQPDSDLWVCADCGKPAHMVLRKLTHMFTPRNATAVLSSHGHQDGISEVRYVTRDGKVTCLFFHPYPRKVDMPDHGHHLKLLWEKLDACIDQIRGDQVNVDLVEVEKVKASTLADVIAQLMTPFYEDSTAVLRESMNRWTARQEGRDDHETPGLAETVWHPDTRFDGTPYSAASEAKARAGRAPKPAPAALDDQKKAFVKHALETGSMEASALASMFGVSIDVIKATVE